MRVNRYLLAVLMAATLVATAGCWYRRPDLDTMYTEVKVGMTKDDVVEVLGEPTAIIESEMFYLYDDPEEPVRFRLVLDENAVVVEKYFETKKELAEKAEETKGEIPPIELVPGEEERGYPGGPLKRFESKPGMPGE